MCQPLSLPLKPSPALAFLCLYSYINIAGFCFAFVCLRQISQCISWLTLSIHFSHHSLPWTLTMWRNPAFTFSATELYPHNVRVFFFLTLSHCKNKLLGFCFCFYILFCHFIYFLDSDFKIVYFFICMWFCLHFCLCTMFLPGIFRGQKMAFRSLDLELHGLSPGPLKEQQGS